jgi:hypothetical protein
MLSAGRSIQPLPRPGRFALRALAAAVAVLTLWTTLVVAFHRHDGTESDHSCVVCAVSHAPATVGAAAQLQAPRFVPAGVVAEARHPAIHVGALRHPSNRAPPAA